MAIKDDLQQIKQELNTEEQFLESIIKSERFVKKYKKPLIALATVLVIAVVGYGINNYIVESNLKASNIAYNKLLKDPNDKKSLEILKNKNKSLYKAYLFQKSIQSADVKSIESFLSIAKNPELKELASYQKASLTQDKAFLNSYTLKQEALLKEFATFVEAYELFKENKIDNAKAKLSSIPMSSPIFQIASSLNHYGIKDN